MQLKIVNSFLVIICLSFTSDLSAGAWTLKTGEGYSQVGFTYIRSSSLFYIDGSRIELKRFVSDITLQGYLEYGLNDKLTFVGIVPYKLLASEDDILNKSFDDMPPKLASFYMDTLDSGKLNAWSNPTAGLRYQLFKKKYVGALQLNVMGRVSSYDKATGLRSGYQAWGFHPAFHLGRGWNHTYFTGDLGVRIRTDDYSNEFISNFEFGYSKTGKTWFIGAINVWKSFYDGNFDDKTAYQTGMYTNNQESYSYGAKFLHKVDESWSVNFSAFGSVKGNLVAHFPALTFGLAYSWKRNQKKGSSTTME